VKRVLRWIWLFDFLFIMNWRVSHNRAGRFLHRGGKKKYACMRADGNTEVLLSIQLRLD
jgi:hypothetical protein